VDDCSQDSGLTRRVLKLYRSLGYVEFWEDLGPPLAPGVRHCNDAARQPHEEALFAFTFRQAKRDGCDWVAAIDVDEFISLDDNRTVPHASVFSTLSSQPNPWYNLAWWVLAGHGLTTKPPGLTLDNYRRGYLNIKHHKTIARSCAVDEWAYSLWPTRWSSRACQKLFGRPLAKLDGVRDAAGRLVSAAPMFLKHYMFRSREEYMRGRGSTARTSNNDKSPWFNNTKAWERGDTLVTGTIGSQFTAKLAQRVAERLRKRDLPYAELHISLAGRRLELVVKLV
jgi:hypothetical protein